MQRTIGVMLLVSTLLAGWAGISVAGEEEFDWGSGAILLGTHRDNYFYRQGNSTKVLPDDTFFSLYLNTFVERNFNDEWYGLFELNSGELRFDKADGQHDFTVDGQQFKQAVLENDFFVRQLRARYRQEMPGRINLDIGKGRLVAGKGLLYDDYTWNVSLRYDLYRYDQIPAVWDARLALIDHESPYVDVIYRYPWSERESLSFSASFFLDRSSSLARIIENGLPLDTKLQLLNLPGGQITPAQLALLGLDSNDLRDENSAVNAALDLESRAAMAWVGAEWHQEFETTRLEVLALGQLGRAEVSFNRFAAGGTTVMRREQDFTALGYLFDLELHIQIPLQPDFTLSPFLLDSSGDSNFFSSIGDGQTRTFLAIRPYNRRATIFFNSGGIVGGYAARSATVSGEEGRGVVAGGLRALWDDDISMLEARGAALWAEFEAPGNGNFYGVETDLEAGWWLLPELRLFAEADLFMLGNYYESKNLDNVWQVLGGVELGRF